MTVDTTVPRSRRALLAASVGGLAALAVAALGRPDRAFAAAGGNLILGCTGNRRRKASSGAIGPRPACR
jgi:hypothetical protein